jgi:hypothetical protein
MISVDINYGEENNEIEPKGLNDPIDTISENESKTELI